jgi:hypothetical protein
VHWYWESNYLGTNWIHPLYGMPVTGGFPDIFGQPPDAFQDGEIGKLQSIVPGPGPSGEQPKPQSGEQPKPQVVGDNPNLPRDPDKFDADVDAQREFRERGVRAASPMKSISTSTSDRLRLSLVVGDEGIGLDDVGESGAGGFETGLDVFTDLLDLGTHVGISDEHTTSVMLIV